MQKCAIFMHALIEFNRVSHSELDQFVCFEFYNNSQCNWQKCPRACVTCYIYIVCDNNNDGLV